MTHTCGDTPHLDCEACLDAYYQKQEEDRQAREEYDRYVRDCLTDEDLGK